MVMPVRPAPLTSPTILAPEAMSRLPVIIILMPLTPPGPIMLPVEVMVRLPVTLNTPSELPSEASSVAKLCSELISISAAEASACRKIVKQSTRMKEQDLFHQLRSIEYFLITANFLNGLRFLTVSGFSFQGWDFLLLIVPVS